jgi:hypothetical protein
MNCHSVHSGRAAFGLLLCLALPRLAAAGANETPGRNHQPHAFGAFLANQFEFGAGDLAIFQEIVVGSQHYRQGAIYADNDTSSALGSGGVWNFFTFCTNRAHDVMLLVSHGRQTPVTLVEIYPHTAAGLAARDAAVAYWNGIFAAGSFIATNSDLRYSISATQTFYTTYFQTPQALCWWATCYSSLLSMTGVAEARDFLGYDDEVFGAKCTCDERRVLSRMDGQAGQGNRPLTAALAGVNGACHPEWVANLVHQGAGNTVLSPSVLDHEPKGVVCNPTPGFVYFDTSMDTRVPPANVVIAYGDGILVDQQWAGDDRITFRVIPIVPCPTIFYDVIESQARSKADLARLDGNLVNPGNAVGPNQDDYIWVTTCPCWPWIPYDVPDLVEIPDPSPGQPTVVYTPVTNHQPIDQVVTVTFSIPGLVQPVAQTRTIVASSTEIFAWDVQIPGTAVEGQSYPMTMVVDDGVNPPFTFGDQLVVQGRFEAALVEGSTLAAGQSNPISIVVWPRGLEPYFDPVYPWYCSLQVDQAWPVQPPQVVLHFADLGAQTVGFSIDVPPGVPAGTEVGLTLRVEGPDGPTLVPLGRATVGLPIRITQNRSVDVVPGNTNGQIPLELLSLSLVSVAPIYVATSSHGFPVQIELPPVLPPNVHQSGSLFLNIPPDPALVGQTGTIDLMVSDGAGNSMVEHLPYVIEPAIEITASTVSLHTGYATPHSFPWQLVLRNRADVLLSGQLLLSGGALSVNPALSTFNLLPNGQVIRNLLLLVPPGLPAGLYPVTAMVQNAQQIGSRICTYEQRVHHPVEPYVADRAISGSEGQVLAVQVEIKNHRPDVTMSGTYQFGDMLGWIIDGVNGTYVLAPGQSTTVTVSMLLGGHARSSSDSLWIQVNQTYDTGEVTQATASIEVIALGISGTPDPVVPLRTDGPVLQPNPFTQSLGIVFALPEVGAALVSVHDATGRRIALVASGRFAAGTHQVTWNGHTADGGIAPTGVYFVRVETPAGQWTRKAVRMN